MLRKEIRKVIRNFVLLLVLSMVAVLAMPGTATAEQTLEIAVPFTSNMILQRQVQVPVWGFDLPGTKVTVDFAGQRKSATANQHGDWMVRFDPLAASREGRVLKVANERDETITLDSVLVGEVWFSSG